MNVRIFDYQPNETFRSECDLLDCFPDGSDDLDYQRALGELKKSGRVWVGGGAAPIVLLVRVS